jgi:hypothetical protein
MVAAIFRTVLAQPDTATVATGPGPRPARPRFPKIGSSIDCAKTEVLAFTVLPGRTGPKSGAPTRSKGSTRRSNAGARGRHLPNDDRHRLVGAILADMHEEMQVGRTALPLRALHGLAQAHQRSGPIAAIDSGE